MLRPAKPVIPFFDQFVLAEQTIMDHRVINKQKDIFIGQ